VLRFFVARTSPHETGARNRIDLGKLKWAASQEAVTLPWLSAHSIRTGIGGDTSMLNPAGRLSRTNVTGHAVNHDRVAGFSVRRLRILAFSGFEGGSDLRKNPGEKWLPSLTL
jgi:hypothetical protein